MKRATIERIVPADIAAALQSTGLAGAGGAGFPSYAKWEDCDALQYMLVNHQESEPNFYADKWLLETHAEEFAVFFEALLNRVLDVVVMGAKERDRTEWMGEFEAATDATIYLPNDLPIDIEQESGLVITYTDGQYQHGMENVLLEVTTDTTMGDDLPSDRGWIIQNTETLYNVYRALDDGTPVTAKYVHVDGDVPRHRFLEVPIGTPGMALIEATGLEPTAMDDDRVVLDGGPGWCFEMDHPLEAFGVRRCTNGLLVTNANTIENNRRGRDRISLLRTQDWKPAEREPEPMTLVPERVYLPLITNPAFEGIVEPSEPTVEPGDDVSEGEVIATPETERISITRHASIDGTVIAVTDSHIAIASE
jgi:Na+-translocating ferredoxin:NAD+ oxidoreductase RnfC subunit